MSGQSLGHLGHDPRAGQNGDEGLPESLEVCVPAIDFVGDARRLQVALEHAPRLLVPGPVVGPERVGFGFIYQPAPQGVGEGPAQRDLGLLAVLGSAAVQDHDGRVLAEAEVADGEAGEFRSPETGLDGHQVEHGSVRSAEASEGPMMASHVEEFVGLGDLQGPAGVLLFHLLLHFHIGEGVLVEPLLLDQEQGQLLDRPDVVHGRLLG